MHIGLTSRIRYDGREYACVEDLPPAIRGRVAYALDHEVSGYAADIDAPAVYAVMRRPVGVATQTHASVIAGCVSTAVVAVTVVLWWLGWLG